MPQKKINLVALALILISFAVLGPGIYYPILTISTTIKLPFVGVMDLGSETRSILGTIQYLWVSKNYLVSSLIFIFSVCVPVLKALGLLFILFPSSEKVRENLLGIIKRIGKWSMADVFIVAVFLAYLSTASMDVLKAKIEKGFYFFLAYCLLSVLATEFILLTHKKGTKTSA